MFFEKEYSDCEEHLTQPKTYSLICEWIVKQPRSLFFDFIFFVYLVVAVLENDTKKIRCIDLLYVEFV